MNFKGTNLISTTPPDVPKGLTQITGELARMKRFPTGWTVATLIDESGRSIPLVGDMSSVTEGMRVIVTVEESVHPKYGLQYAVKGIQESGFGNTEGIIRYLAGEDFFNIGVVTARAIVDHFGMQTLDILDADVSRVKDVPNISSNRKKAIIEGWNKAREEHRVLADLINLGMMPTDARRAHRFFKEDAVKKVKENPYDLTSVPHIGFRIADAVALKMGIPRDSEKRIGAAITFALSLSLSEGHCYVQMSDLRCNTIELLQQEIGDKLLIDSLNLMVSRNILTIEQGRIYLTYIYNAEREVASVMKALTNFPSEPLYSSISEMMKDIYSLDVLGIVELDIDQQAAIFMAINNRGSVITGGPGTGKSTITKILIALFKKHQIKYELCSPTGMAAKRLGNATGEPARTIHRMLEFSPMMGGFQRCAQNPLNTDCVTIDESSMVDITLFRHMLEAMERNDRLVIIGDADQLPSVGPGNVLRDIIASSVIPVTRLTRIFRQAAGNTIITVAHDILHGKMPELPTPKNRGTKNCMFVGADDLATLRQYVVTLVQKTLPALGYKPEQIQVLTPMRGKGAGVEDLNPVLQEALNPSSSGKAEIKANNRILRVGDRVMQIRNDYEKLVFNGEVGTIASIAQNQDNSVVTIFVQYPDVAAPVEYKRESWEDIQLAYASTIHKSQGSEYPAVVMVLHHTQWIMLQRNLFYTGLTRAKGHCIIIGTKSAVQRAVENGTERKRNTTLKQLLQS